ICIFHDIGEFNELPFLIMECLEGETIHQRVATRAFQIGDLVDTAIQIADALDAAHSRDVMHRDIKPANIFLTNRVQIKVMDFSLAKVTFAQSTPDSGPSSMTALLENTLTNPGTTLGTIAYMSPEQASNEEVDFRTDLFSFGVVLYEMATGLNPFQSNT